MGKDLIKVRIEEKSKIFIHNDLSGASEYFLEKVKSRVSRDDRDGMAFDIMAGIVLLAFTFEAQINFLGHKIIPDWQDKERSLRFKERVEAVVGKLELSIDWGQRPFQSVSELNRLRDQFAHGKPIYHNIDKEWIGTHEELQELEWMHTGVERYLRSDCFERYFSDVEFIWRCMLEKSGIEIFDTFTQSSGGTTFIGKVS